MLKGLPVTGVCSFCEQEVTGHPVMAGRSDLILTGGSAGDPLRAHYLARNAKGSSAIPVSAPCGDGHSSGTGRLDVAAD
jgi:hypothetical protein